MTAKNTTLLHGFSHMIRIGVPDDLEAIYEIEQRCFSGDRLSRRSIRRSLMHSHHRLRVACESDILAGYLLSFVTPHHRRMRHYSLAVLPEYRGKFLARALLLAAQADALACKKTGMRLEIRTDNIAAYQLYTSLGYRPAGIKKGYYDDTQDALLMIKDFT